MLFFLTLNNHIANFVIEITNNQMATSLKAACYFPIPKVKLLFTDTF